MMATEADVRNTLSAVEDTVRGSNMDEAVFRYHSDSVFSLPCYGDAASTFPSCELLNIGGYGMCIGLLTGVVILLLICFVNVKNLSALIKKLKLRWITDIGLKWWFFASWVFSFTIYDVGQYTGEPWSLVTSAPMAIIHAFESFLLGSDVSAIHEPFHNNFIFMLCFGASHCLAALVSMMVVLKYFGFNIKSGLSMYWKSHFSRTADCATYIFWGLNDAVYHMAQSIREWHSQQPGKSKYRIIVVRSNDQSNDCPTPNSMERIMGFLSLRKPDIKMLQKLDCLTTSTYDNLANMDIPSSHGGHTNIIRGELKLNSLARLIRRTKNDRLYFLFLSDDERGNILATVNLKKDSTINDWLKESAKRKVKLYCHARYNGVHRVIEDHEKKSRIEVNVIDSSHICVDMLKNKDEFQPVNFVKVEDDATVSTEFNSLVVGFSEVGQDTVRFLYEFGAFVKTGSTDDHVERSPFHCHVVDKNMADIAGSFVANLPNITISMPFMRGGIREHSPITLHQMDCRGVEFYKAVERWIGDLNYIVLATNDDELNITLAIRIFRMAIRYRKDMEQLCILVRLHNDDEGHYGRIVSHYNRLWEAEMNHDNKNRLHQSKQRNCDKEQHRIIHIFGLDSTTYTYGNVINEDVVNHAKSYKYKYDKAIVELKKRSGVTDESQFVIKDWDTEEQELMQINNTLKANDIEVANPYKDCVPTYTAIMRLRRVQTQNIANSMHNPTKHILASRALHDADLRVFDGQHLFRKEGELKYVWKEYVKPDPTVIRVLDVLAQTEHLRWNAAHELLGFIACENEDNKDEAKLIHGCIRNWEQLNTEHKSYDYNVVDVSMGIVGVKE